MNTTTVDRLDIPPPRSEERLAACPHCGHGQRIRSEQVGRRIACRKCEQPFRVPAEGDPTPVALEAEIQQAREELDARKANLKARIHQQRVTLLESEIRRAREELDSRTAAHTAALGKLREAEGNLSRLRGQARDLRGQLDRVRQEAQHATGWRDQLAEVRSENERLQALVESLRGRIEEVGRADEIEPLEEWAGQPADEIRAACDEVERLCTEFRGRSTRPVEASTRELEAVRVERDRLRDEARATQAELDSLRRRVDELDQERARVAARCDSLEAARQAARGELDAQVARLHRELEELRERADREAREGAELARRDRALRAELERQRREREEERQELCQHLSVMHRDLEAARAEVDSLRKGPAGAAEMATVLARRPERRELALAVPPLSPVCDDPDPSVDEEEEPASATAPSRSFLGRAMMLAFRFAIPAGLVLVPLVTIVYLTKTVLWPTASDPQSMIYPSAIGHPSIQRFLRRPIEIPVAKAERETASETLAAAGETVALQKVDVRPAVEGTTERIEVVEGQQVKRGQVLARLVQGPIAEKVAQARNSLEISRLKLESLPKLNEARKVAFQADIETAEKQLSIARREMNRSILLRKRGSVSDTEVLEKQEVVNLRQSELVGAKQKLAEFEIEAKKDAEQARLTHQSDIIALRQAERDLERTTICSPIDGLVSSVKIHPGELVEQGTLLLTLMDQVVFKAYVDQSRLNAVKVGDRAMMRLVSHPGGTFPGEVIRVNPTVESATEAAPKVGVDRRFTYSVWIKFDTLRIPTGLQGYAEFSHPQASLVVPESSVIHLSSGEGMVLVTEGDRAKVRKVELGQTRGGSREVLGGLEPGQSIALHPRALRPNDRVRAQTAPAKP